MRSLIVIMFIYGTLKITYGNPMERDKPDDLEGNCVITSGQSCVFPFTFHGVTYTSCTSRGGYSKPWCSTNTDVLGNHIPGQWEHCIVECGFENTVNTDWVEYYPGTLPLIISVPHNGHLNLTIPIRVAGCKNDQDICQFPGQDNCPASSFCKVVTVADSWTKVIGKGVYKGLGKEFGRSPHLIISKLHRGRMDPNTEIEVAAQGNDEAIEAYNSYHNLLAKISESISVSSFGLLIDLHGQVHHQNSSELGYLISKSRLNSGNTLDEAGSSIRSLVFRNDKPLEDLLWGPTSLGYLLENQGFAACPSPSQHSPGNQSYFNGGYITKTYGSQNGGVVDAIQIEAPSEVRREGGSAMRDSYIDGLVEALSVFLKVHYL